MQTSNFKKLDSNDPRIWDLNIELIITGLAFWSSTFLCLCLFSLHWPSFWDCLCILARFHCKTTSLGRHRAGPSWVSISVSSGGSPSDVLSSVFHIAHLPLILNQVTAAPVMRFWLQMEATHQINTNMSQLAVSIRKVCHILAMIIASTWEFVGDIFIDNVFF